jgi:HlyD family secretion protein
MTTPSKFDELNSLRIPRDELAGPQPPLWARRYIQIGITVLVVLGVLAIAYRLLVPSLPEVQVARAVADGGNAGGVVLSASGYIVAHHKINVNSKVTGRVAWIGVEKGDKVQQGQVLVRLEDQEFRAQVEQARGAVASARARLAQLENGSRPEEIEQAQHNLEEARATLGNDQANLERVKPLVAAGFFSKQQLDEAQAKFEASQHRVKALEQAFRLARIGPRVEEIQRARGDLLQAQGQLALAESYLDATQIRAPVSGTILERTAEKGELVTAQFASGAEGGPRGSAVALADLTDLQVELDISQDDFARLGPKQRGIVTTDAYPDRKYDGVIAEISPEANRQKATVQVKVRIQKPDSYLRPDMNAKVDFLADQTRSNAGAGIFVPSGAVREREGKHFVLVCSGGKALERPVRLIGRRSDGDVVEGLSGGESVIVKAPADVKDGTKVKVIG